MVVELPENQTAEQVINAAIDHCVYAEELGYDAIWLAEHHFTNYGAVPSPAVLAAAIAAKTKRIKIGIAVAVLPFHDPIRVAEDYALLDVISGGRLVFGVGRGYQPHEFKGFGIPMEEARERFDESMQIIDGLWRNESFSFSGKHFKFENVKLVPRPIQKPAPQMWVAAVSPDTFVRVAKAGKPFLTSPSFTPIEKIKQGFAAYRSALVAAGHPANPTLPLQRHAYIAESKEEAYSGGRAPFLWYLAKNAELMSAPDVSDPSYQMYKKAQRNKASASYDTFFNSDATLICTPEEAVRRIAHLRDELDLNYMLCTFMFGGMDPAKANKSMKLFADRVMPHFRN